MAGVRRSSHVPACAGSATPLPSLFGATAGWRKGSTDAPFAMDVGARPPFPLSPQRWTRRRRRGRIRLQRAPRTGGPDQPRWTLAGIRPSCTGGPSRALPGVHTIRDRLHVVWKRTRASRRSPAPEDDDQRAVIAVLLVRLHAAPERSRLGFLDAVPIARQPTLTTADAVRGDDQVRAYLRQRATTLARVGATLDGRTVQVGVRRATRSTAPTLALCAQALRATDLAVACIDVGHDPWTEHPHPDRLVVWEPHPTPAPCYRLSHWSTKPSAAASRKRGPVAVTDPAGAVADVCLVGSSESRSWGARCGKPCPPAALGGRSPPAARRG
ncbi:hypothetical protein Rcas_3631 [Roseiflexus castenholzii DSM 13941]|uniref:Uncharacterized protein n=1 Tax=Roseiflexus castenholzii (strain DSM 13941 / HLO8) TaxID=383372 RepID=A7NQ34_ROSCS|nr:hypothetical protein Rcas_3631 [Roseiflexus castenholzii DSM 13941]